MLYIRHQLLCFFSLLLLAACEESAPAPPAVVGAYGFDGYEPLFWAETLGLFPERSVHLVESTFDLGILQAFRGATVNVQALTLTRALQWEQEEVDAIIILPLVASEGLEQIMAHANVMRIEDLRGKRVGVELGTVNEYLLRRALEKAGMNFDDITVINRPYDDLGALLLSGNVAAISVYDFVPDGADTPLHTLFTSADIPGEIIDVLVARGDFAREYPERLTDLIYGYLKSIAFYDRLDDTQPLPVGVMRDNEFKRDIQGVRFLRAGDIASMLTDDARALRSLISERRSFAGPHTADGDQPVPIDSRPFFMALERLEAEGGGR